MGERYTAPFDNPWDSLTPGARSIVHAATDLLAEEGYEALTYERIAERAGVNKSTIRYNFGDKASLVAAVVDAMIHDGCLRLAQTLAGAGPEERIDEVVKAIGQMIVVTEAFRGYFDILPHALRDPRLRKRLLGLNHWWYQQNLHWLGLDGECSPATARLRLGVGHIIAALIDGLSIQAALDPDFDSGPALDVVARILKELLPVLHASQAT